MIGWRLGLTTGFAKAKAEEVNSGPLAHTLYADLAALNATEAREVLIPSTGVKETRVEWTVLVLLILFLSLVINKSF